MEINKDIKMVGAILLSSIFLSTILAFAIISTYPETIETPVYIYNTSTIKVPEIVHDSKVETQVVTVEVPYYLIINNTETIIETIEIPTIIKETVYIEKTLRDFQSLNHLKLWLYGDHTDNITYSPDFNCDEFAWRLKESAYNSQYRIEFLWEYNRATMESHAANIAYITDIAKWVKIEPQSDEITILWTDDG